MTTAFTSSSSNHKITLSRCYACDKLGASYLVACIDDQTVFVGADCFRKIKKAGAIGYQPQKGGPRLFTIAAKEARTS